MFCFHENCQKIFSSSGMAHAWNLSYLEGRDWEDSPGKTLVRPHLNKQAGRCVSGIPAMQEA
jgi:hypothetical protein